MILPTKTGDYEICLTLQLNPPQFTKGPPKLTLPLSLTTYLDALTKDEARELWDWLETHNTRTIAIVHYLINHTEGGRLAYEEDRKQISNVERWFK